jgi:hypothetical protein
VEELSRTHGQVSVLEEWTTLEKDIKALAFDRGKGFPTQKD